LYDIPSGKLQTYEIDDGSKLPIIRDADPPCHICPKGGPENDRLLVVSRRNEMAWRLYQKLEACHGAYRLPDYLATCEVWAENMRLVREAIQLGKAVAKSNAYREARKESEDSVT